METGEQEKSRKRIFSPSAFYFGGILLFYMGLMLNWQIGHLRFVNPSFNYLVFAAGQFVPFAVFLNLFRVKNWAMKTFGYLIAAPVCVLAALLFLFAGSSFLIAAGSFKDASYELQQTISQVSPPVKVYRTDGGAMTHFGILIQSQRPVLPGVVWAVPLYNAYPAAEVNITVVDSHHLRCVFPRYGSEWPETKPVILTVN